MCSEEDPRGCHRRLLIARVLDERGVGIVHIRGDGSLQSEAGLLDVAARNQTKTGQLPLFEAREVKPKGDAWRSIRSVSPKRAHPSSSKQ
jgi:hypothetical protein